MKLSVFPCCAVFYTQLLVVSDGGWTQQSLLLGTVTTDLLAVICTHEVDNVDGF